MEKSVKSEAKAKTEKPSLKARIQRIKNKLLSSYYGNPIKDMKLICVVGTKNRVAVARMAHEIMKVAGLNAAVLASDEPIKAGMLHKFFNEAWKANNNYVIVTVAAGSLENNVFYGLPVHVAALTDFSGSDEALAAVDSLFATHPAIVILNHDDVHYEHFAKFIGATDTYSYGMDGDAVVRIDRSTLYARGTEANLVFGNKAFTVASFLTGEPVVTQMTAATTIATALHIAPATIAEGVANFEDKDMEGADGSEAKRSV